MLTWLRRWWRDHEPASRRIAREMRARLLHPPRRTYADAEGDRRMAGR